jgi:hypothetical protein
MSPFKSSNSLQNSVYSYSFTKQQRFNGMYQKLIVDCMYDLPASKSMRFTSQGFGNKTELKNPSGKGSPAPNSYRIKSCFDSSIDHKKGPIFLERFTPMVILLFYY